MSDKQRPLATSEELIGNHVRAMLAKLAAYQKQKAAQADDRLRPGGIKPDLKKDPS